MSRCNIYLDESGDLGFKFDAPYRSGGSSRHLTLAAAICAGDSNKHLKRFMADFYTAREIPAGEEKKWVDLKPGCKVDFATRAEKLVVAHPEVSFACITVYKPKVMPHIQKDPNKLYNFMAAILLLPIMKNFDEVFFIPDARSLRVETGSSLHDYLQTQLWFSEKTATKLVTNPSDSAKCRPLHFADYLCGSFQSHHEDSNSDCRNVLSRCTKSHRLFFP